MGGGKKRGRTNRCSLITVRRVGLGKGIGSLLPLEGEPGEWNLKGGEGGGGAIYIGWTKPSREPDLSGFKPEGGPLNRRNY